MSSVAVPSGDLSFQRKNGQKVEIILSEFADRIVVVLSNLGKVGHVVDLFFPKDPGFVFRSAVAEYEAKVIFGPDTVSILTESRYCLGLLRPHLE